MKQFTITLIILLALCGAFFYALSWPRGLGGERAVGGVLDLTGADFAQTRHNLDGEWEFFFGALYTPEDFAGGTVSEGTIINVPGSWTNAGYPFYGYATYRLTIKTDEPLLMMLVPQISFASVIWVNNERVFEVGTVGKTREETSSGVSNAFVTFSPIDDRAEIIVQAANYNFFFSGLVYNIEIGRRDVLLNDAILRRVLLGAFIGMLLTVFVYHFILFLHRRKEWVYLVFALFCLVSAVRFVVDSNGLFVLFWTMNQTVWMVFSVSMFLTVVTVAAFTHIVFKIPFSTAHRWLYGIPIGVFMLYVLAIPFGGIDERATLIGVLLPVTALFSALRSKRMSENYYNYLYLVALGVYCVWVFIQRFVLGDFLYMPAVAQTMLMVVAQFFMLSVSYAREKEAEQRLAVEKANLEKLSRIKTDFLNDIKHEVRTPLHIISIGTDFTNQCLSKNGMEQEARNMQGIIQDEAIRLGRMIEGMVELATESEPGNHGGLRRQRTDFEDLLKTGVQNNRLALEQRGNTLRQEIRPDLPYVYVDAIQLTRVLQNLFSNAAAGTENGEITISAKADESYVTVCVSDTGEGIPAELLPDVFKRGVSGKGGKGFGLSICKTIVEAHSGTIEIKSGQNKGTSVTFTIPVYGGQREEVTA